MGKLFDRPRPPRSLVIMGKRIKVHVRDYLEDSDGDELAGYWCPKTEKIFLSRGHEWRTTLLHEVMHSILTLSGASAGLHNDVEEIIISALEEGLFPILG